MWSSATTVHKAGELEDRPATKIQTPIPTTRAEIAYANALSIGRSKSKTGSIAPVGLATDQKVPTRRSARRGDGPVGPPQAFAHQAQGHRDGKLFLRLLRLGEQVSTSQQGSSFSFLGFDFRYLRSLRGAMRPHYTPKLKTRTALLRGLKEVFRRHRSQPIGRV